MDRTLCSGLFRRGCVAMAGRIRRRLPKRLEEIEKGDAANMAWRSCRRLCGRGVCVVVG